MTQNERLINFVILICTDNEELFCKAYKALSPKTYSMETKIGHGMWRMISDDFQKKYKEMKRSQYLKNIKPRIKHGAL
ncbi:MAG: hypothetical protein KBT21_08580 [Treponema sp.]|nr:hypothetical protein [Candidatus Treponema merdequi]